MSAATRLTSRQYRLHITTTRHHLSIATLGGRIATIFRPMCCLRRAARGRLAAGTAALSLMSINSSRKPTATCIPFFSPRTGLLDPATAAFASAWLRRSRRPRILRKIPMNTPPMPCNCLSRLSGTNSSRNASGFGTEFAATIASVVTGFTRLSVSVGKDIPTGQWMSVFRTRSSVTRRRDALRLRYDSRRMAMNGTSRTRALINTRALLIRRPSPSGRWTGACTRTWCCRPALARSSRAVTK